MTKRLVLCLDGTSNTPSREKERADGSKVFRPLNVLKLARAVLPTATAADHTHQIVYYDTGVGAMAEYPGYTNGVLRWFDSKLGGALGAGFEGNVDDAYRFIAQNSEEGDSVYVFGYSRGAAEAQAPCKFIDWMHGVPAKSDIFYVPRFYLRYLETRGEPDAFDRLKHGIETTGRNIGPLAPFRRLRVRMLGLWDTVMALGSRLARQMTRHRQPTNDFLSARSYRNASMSPAMRSPSTHCARIFGPRSGRKGTRPISWCRRCSREVTVMLVAVVSAMTWPTPLCCGS